MKTHSGNLFLLPLALALFCMMPAAIINAQPRLPTGATARGDINFDTHPDYVLFQPNTRATAVWFMQENAFLSSAFGPTLPPGWTLSAIGGPFDNTTTRPAYILTNQNTRQTALWFMNNQGQFQNGTFGPTLPPGWNLIAAIDFNNSNGPDYILFNPSTRRTALWYMSGPVVVGTNYGPTLPPGWVLNDVADFNADLLPEFLISNPTTGRTAVWYLHDATFASGAYGPTLPSGWALEGGVDFNNDNKPDLVLTRTSTRQTAIWYLNGTTFSSAAFGPTIASGYRLVFP